MTTTESRSRGSAGGRPVARDAELGLVVGVLTGALPSCGVIVTGEAGIGKTTVRSAALATELGDALAATVTCFESEQRVDYVHLTDLLEQLPDDAFEALPEAQRQALAAVRLQAEPRPDIERMVLVATLALVRSVAATRPVVLAYDDLQWLDPATDRVLAYVARRIEPELVRFLLTRRPGDPTEIETALGDDVERLELAPLAPADLTEIVNGLTTVALPAALIERVVAEADGNPLYAVSLAQEVARQGVDPGRDAALPLPDRLAALLTDRLRRLSPGARDVVLALALEPGLSRQQLMALDAAGVAEAVEVGAAREPDGLRLRLGHPLFAAAVRRVLTPVEIRDLHRRLAGLVPGEEARLRHLALAQVEADAGLAAELAEVAAQARRRHVRSVAIDLLAQAVRLTPPGDPGYAERAMDLADLYVEADRMEEGHALLTDLGRQLPPGPTRARVWLTMIDCGLWDDLDERLDMLEAEGGEVPDLRARALMLRAHFSDQVVDKRGNIAQALALFDEMSDDWMRFSVLHNTVSIYEQLGIVPTPEFVARAAALEARFDLPAKDRVDYILANLAANRGETVRARTEFTAMLEEGVERDDPASRDLVGASLGNLEMLTGSVDAAAAHWGMKAGSEFRSYVALGRRPVVLAANRGDADALPLAEETLADPEQTWVPWLRWELNRALAMAALLAGDPDRAVAALQEPWEEVSADFDPGFSPFAGEYVEALALSGAHDRAREVADQLAARAEALDHPWARATVLRGRALVLVAERRSEQAVVALEAAAAAYGAIGHHFERARVLVHLGGVWRRQGLRREAREPLLEARDVFTAQGRPGWAAWAERELARIPGRRRSEGVLTEAEAVIARLAATGKRNAEIARELVISVSTVEVTLTRVYRKLGISQRHELAGRLADEGI